MSARVLVTHPAGCEATSALAGQVAAILDDRWVDAFLVPIGRVTNLEAYDGVVLGVPLSGRELPADVADFVSRHAGALQELPTALFGLRSSAVSEGEAGAPLDPLRALVDPLTVGVFPAPPEGEPPPDRGWLPARIWSAQLSWTLHSACRPEEETQLEGWPFAAAASR